MSATHPALVLPPGLYEAAQFPVADGYLPIRVETLGAWAEYDPAEGEAYRVSDPIAYFDNHGPMRPIDPREVPDL